MISPMLQSQHQPGPQQAAESQHQPEPQQAAGPQQALDSAEPPQTPPRMADWPVLPPRKKKRRKKKLFPPAHRSARLYLTIDPSKVHLFRYFLEAEDNLALMTVVDRWRAALMVRFSPQQEQELRDCLERMRLSLPFEGPFSLAAPSSTTVPSWATEPSSAPELPSAPEPPSAPELPSAPEPPAANAPAAETANRP